MPFFILLMLVLVVGLISLFSASYAYAYYWYEQDSYYFIKRQLFFAVLGVGIMLLVSVVDYHVLHRLAIPVMLLSWALLVLVLFPAGHPKCPPVGSGSRASGSSSPS